jgi:Flp pilus assembly protein TadG
MYQPIKKGSASMRLITKRNYRKQGGAGDFASRVRVWIGDNLDRFAEDRRGNFLVAFAFLLIPLFTAVGVAIDYSRASAARSEAQNAIDAGLLAYLSEYVRSSDAKSGEATARKFMDANFADASAWTWDIEKPVVVNNVVTLKATGKGNLGTTFMQLVGRDSVDLAVAAAVKSYIPQTSIVLVTDVSDSMKGAGRMPAMRAALKKFSKEIYAVKDENVASRIRIGMVPFAATVNLGNYEKQAGRFLTGWEYSPHPTATPDRISHYQPVAVAEGRFKDVQKLNMSGGSPNFAVTRFEYKSGSWVKVGDQGDRPWSNCIQMKATEYGNDDMLDKNGSMPFPSVIYPGWDALCPDQASSMVADIETESDFNHKVDGLTLGWGTGIGLEWAARLLSPNWADFFDMPPQPWNEPESYPKYVVLLSDGGAVNEFGFGDQTGQDVTFSLAAVQTVCSYLKSKDVTVFSVSYEMGAYPAGHPAKKSMRDCGTPGFTYEANTANIDEVIAEIADRIKYRRMYVSK